MSLPSPLPLDDFERAIQADPEILGVFYFGSLGRGAAGPFSDLDIGVWVTEDVPLPSPDKLLKLLALLGEVHWLAVEHGTGWVGPGWVQVDIELDHLEAIKPSPRFAGATVIKDRGGALARIMAASLPEQFAETAESAAQVIREAIDDQLFNARHNARGSVWSAMGGVSYWCYRTYELLGRLRGRRTYGYRYVEELLTPDEQALLAAAWPREPTRDEVRRAARALWGWTKYVWRESERAVGQPLGIELDEHGMLAAIDRMYG